MKPYYRIISNWMFRIRKYGLLNSLRLFRYLKRDGEYSIKLHGKDIFLRGNTVDFIVFNSVFGKEEYRFDPGFNPAVIIDAGANIGASTLYFSLKYPEATIIALEPEESNFRLLKKNTSGYRNVVCRREALWGTDTDLYINNPVAEKYAFQVKENSIKNSGIRGIRVDTLISVMNIPHIDILKMDIEGAEYSVFAEGDLEWIKKVRILVIELHNYIHPGVEELFYETLSQITYKEVISGENHIIFNLNEPI